ncbi:MAG: DUF933 domain-containing protein [Desulfohalobiaceae bacterium]|nr:DUF933 domain-containing protein [Desulfohalobiaceae bacterium]
MKTALFGPPGTGKTELFRALGQNVSARSDRIMVKVPEPRLETLVEVFHPRKVTPTEIEYVDIPGGSGKKEGLEQRVLSEVRPCDCLLAVLDGFSGFFDPGEQWREVETELVISDMAVAEKRLERMRADRHKNKDLVDPEEQELLERVVAHLEKEEPLRTDPALSAAHKLRGFRFLSAKPVLYVWNVAESELDSFSLPADGHAQGHVVLSAHLERELAEIEDPQERQAFFRDMGIQTSALEKVVASTYRMLGLITFLTAGEKEVRAWTLPRGDTAADAAETVHSDIRRGFIRAEVLSWSDFERLKSFKRAREEGVLRLEGKDYVVRDGDIITFRFNV